MRSVIASVLTLLVTASIVAAPADVTTVILVRHAEKAPAAAMAPDVPLSDACVERAFVCSIAPGAAPKLVVLHYGAPAR
jgi:hypothetical protein